MFSDSPNFKLPENVVNRSAGPNSLHLSTEKCPSLDNTRHSDCRCSNLPQMSVDFGGILSGRQKRWRGSFFPLQKCFEKEAMILEGFLFVISLVQVRFLFLFKIWAWVVSGFNGWCTSRRRYLFYQADLRKVPSENLLQAFGRTGEIISPKKFTFTWIVFVSAP